MPDDEPSTPAPPPSYGGAAARGGGGKLRKDRKPPSTPYDRPPRTTGGGGGWLSTAKRFISGGATRLLPSLFSPLPPPPPLESSNRDEESTEAEQENVNHKTSSSSALVVPESSGSADPNNAKGKSKICERDRAHPDGPPPDIEQLIKGKTFSRGEIDHLMEILRSRVVDAEQERQLPSVSGLDEAQKAETSQENINALVDKEEDLAKFKWATTTPLPRPTVQDEIGASPVDIARAYMGSRTSETGFMSTSLIPKSEKFSLNSELSSKQYMPSPLSKAPVCWPGAITQDRQDYSTPQSQKSRYGLQNFPRTPYSRTIYAKSKSKLTPFQGDREKLLNISSTPFQPTRSPVYGKSRSNVGGGGYGSGGPIRSTRNKFPSVTPARESMLHNVNRSPWAKESSVDFMFKKNSEAGTSTTPNNDSVNRKPQNFEVGVPSVHPHSSKLARQILEQLDRPITLKEKSDELKLAASWKNMPRDASATPTRNSKSAVVDAVKLGAQTDGENDVLPQDRTNAFGGAGKNLASASTTSLDKTSTSGINVGPPLWIQKLDSQAKSSDQAISNNLSLKANDSWLYGDSSKRTDITNSSSLPESQNTQRKPLLASISVDKSGMKTSFASDASAGFSFPVTKSPSLFVEPPTPSIMPSSSTSPPQQSKPSASFPTFTFGNKITIAPPVVPSPSTSSASMPNDTSAPKFKFGLGKTRLSFALLDIDAASAPCDAAIPKYKFRSGQNRLNFGMIENDAVRC